MDIETAAGEKGLEAVWKGAAEAWDVPLCPSGVLPLVFDQIVALLQTRWNTVISLPATGNILR